MGGRLSVFVDTSALLAVLDRDDQHHGDASRQLRTFVEQRAELLSHNYVVLESTALVQRRLGIGATRSLHLDLLLAIDVVWVDHDLHRTALAALLASNRRRISLVDQTSFELMRATNTSTAFAFDEHFRAAGFETVP